MVKSLLNDFTVEGSLQRGALGWKVLRQEVSSWGHELPLLYPWPQVLTLARLTDG